MLPNKQTVSLGLKSYSHVQLPVLDGIQEETKVNFRNLGLEAQSYHPSTQRQCPEEEEEDQDQNFKASLGYILSFRLA